MKHMTGSLRHRGPDDAGCMIADGIAVLGHTRLSIIDLSEHGHQPMGSEDGNVQVVFNGEIYNFHALRQTLIQAGHRFSSRTDTEILVHGFEEWGLVSLLDKLEGMFAFAVWERDAQRLWLARDPFGIKPLYYWKTDGQFRFASEIKALLAADEHRPPQDDAALLLSFQHIGIPAPHTMYCGCRQLPPATWLCFNRATGQVTEKSYWTWEIAPDLGDPEAAADALWEAICRSVEKHLIADVPVGLFLSGGLDSSLVAAACAEVGRKPTCLTIALDQPDHDESPYAASVSRYFGLPHQVEPMGADTGREDDACLASIFDEPFASSAALSTAYVTRIAARNFKVMLSGEGGDELFGGYDWYRKWLAFYGDSGGAPAAWRTPKNTLRRLAGGKHMSPDPMAGYARLMGGYPLRQMKRLFAPDLLAAHPTAADAAAWYRQLDQPERRGFDRLQTLDMRLFLPTVCLRKMDRCSMACSLEVRVPFLDRTIAAVVGRIPATVRNPDHALKGLLKQIAADKLPADVLQKPKQGFSTPIRQWFPKEEILREIAVDQERGDWWQRVFAPDVARALRGMDGRPLWRFWHTWRWVRDAAVESKAGCAGNPRAKDHGGRMNALTQRTREIKTGD